MRLIQLEGWQACVGYPLTVSLSFGRILIVNLGHPTQTGPKESEKSLSKGRQPEVLSCYVEMYLTEDLQH